MMDDLQRTPTLSYRLAGDHAIIFYLPEPLRDNYPLILHGLAESMKRAGAVDVVPAYHSVLVVFDKNIHTKSTFIELANMHLSALVKIDKNRAPQRVVRIPVCYDESFGIDLAKVADQHQTTLAEVIRRHHNPIYTVCCLGFIPGFAFLGYVDEGIATPRHAEPRHHVAAGSVGIAGRQTGIYPADSPGGWNIIGRTPKTLYDPAQGLLSCFELGDSVQFYPISLDEFNTWVDDGDN